MRILKTLVFLGLAASPAFPQLYVPAQSSKDPLEANDRTNYPLMRAESRSQFVIAASEIGPATTLTKLSLRYNGPSYGLGGGTIQNFDIYLANTTVAPGSSQPIFGANYTGSLTKVFSAQSLAFGTDASANPSPWGGPSGEFHFVFQTPFNYTGGNLIVEIRADGNTNAGATPFNCLLDAERDGRAGASGGSAVSHGTGCHGVTAQIAGQLAPGGQIALAGSGLGANGTVFANLGVSRAVWGVIPLPFSMALFNAPGCWIYNDWSISLPLAADASGNIAPYTAGATLLVPNVAALAGAVLQFQYFSIQPGINPFNAATSNNVEVTLGTNTPSARGYQAHFHHFDRDALIATYSAPIVLAMRFNG